MTMPTDWTMTYGGLSACEWRRAADACPDDHARVLRRIADVLDEIEQQLREETS